MAIKYVSDDLTQVYDNYQKLEKIRKLPKRIPSEKVDSILLSVEKQSLDILKIKGNQVPILVRTIELKLNYF